MLSGFKMASVLMDFFFFLLSYAFKIATPLNFCKTDVYYCNRIFNQDNELEL